MMETTSAWHCRAWTARDAAGDDGWILRLSPEAIAGLDRALDQAQAHGKDPLDMTADDFLLPTATTALLQAAIRTTQGPWGMCLVKGFPVDRWTEAQTRLAYWGVSLHLGVARTQNRASQYINDVRDEGGSYRTTNGRGYNTKAKLDFHADSCDVVGLLCRRDAMRGGDSKVVSSIAVRDTIARQRPDLAEVLTQPWFHSYQGAQGADQPPYYPCPLVGSHPWAFAMRTNRKNIVAAQRDFTDVPRLTAAQAEALDLLDRVMADPSLCFSMTLERGDLQLLNSYVTLHSRTDFDDFDEPDRKRHLLRLWLAVPQSQPLPSDWAVYFGDIRAGSVRGGLRGQGASPAFLRYEARQAARLGMPLALPSVAATPSLISSAT